jgi:hypothetical protein
VALLDLFVLHHKRNVGAIVLQNGNVLLCQVTLKPTKVGETSKLFDGHSLCEGMFLSYLSHYDIMTHSPFDSWHHNKISKARRANNMTRDSKSVNLTHFRRLSICNLFHETHLIHMTTSEESLRVLFFTHSLAIDLVH